MSNSNIDVRRPFFADIARGLRDVTQGRVLSEGGKGKTIVAFVTMAAALQVQGLKDEYDTFVRACRSIHADPKESRMLYADGWAYFRNNIGDVLSDVKVKPDAVSLVKVTSDAEKNTVARKSTNSLTSARESVIRAAASVVSWFDACGVVWTETNSKEEVSALITASKSGDYLRVYEATNMERLFPKRDKSIASTFKDHDYATVGNYQAFTFGTLEENGNADMQQKGMKKIPVNRNTAGTAAMRDQLKVLSGTGDGSLDKADAASYDAPADDNLVLKTFIAAATALNDGSLKHTRFNNVVFTVSDWIARGVAAESKGEPLPDEYKALVAFASDYMDKSKATRKVA